MEFSLLGFRLACDIFSFQFNTFRMRMPILCLPHHCIFEADNFFPRFHRYTDGEKFCPRVDQTQGLTHTWFWWFRTLDLVLPELIITCRKEVYVKMQVVVGVMHILAKNTEKCQPPSESKRVKEGSSARSFRESMTLPTLWFWTCCPQ